MRNKILGYGWLVFCTAVILVSLVIIAASVLEKF